MNFRFRLLRLGRRRGLQHDPRQAGATIRRRRASSASRSRRPWRSAATARSSAAAATPASSTISTASRSPTRNGPARFKWSQWNGGLAGRGRFDATVDAGRVIIDAGRAAIVNSGLAEFYLEALQYDELVGAWNVVYGAMATLNTDHDLELTAPPAFGALPSTTDPVFFRLVERHRRHRGVHQRGRLRWSCATASASSSTPRPRATIGPATTGPSRCAPARSPIRRCWSTTRRRPASSTTACRWPRSTGPAGRNTDDQRHDRGLPQALPAAHQPEDLLHLPDRRRRYRASAISTRSKRPRRICPPAGGELCLLPGPAPREPDARRPAQRHHPRLRAALARAAAHRNAGVPIMQLRRLRRRPHPRPRSAHLRRHRGA